MQQIILVWMLQKVLQIRHGLLTPFSTLEREAVKTNARWNPLTFSSKQQKAGWNTSSQATESDKKPVHLPSAPDLTHSVFHRCKFWDWNTFLSSKVFDQYVGICEPKLPRFRFFDPRGVKRVNFSWQLVKFGPVKFTLLPHINHAHSPSDHHWLFCHVYKRFNCEMKINGRVLK